MNADKSEEPKLTTEETAESKTDADDIGEGIGQEKKEPEKDQKNEVEGESSEKDQKPEQTKVTVRSIISFFVILIYHCFKLKN